MYIETERLIIRSFCENDADALYAIKTDPQVMEYCPDLLDVEVRPEDMVNYIREFNRLEDVGDIDTWRCYAIENRETGEVMGCLTTGIQVMLREYELGWMMLSRFARKGYASEAAATYAERFCSENDIDYIIAVTDVDNDASIRTAEKSGFRLFEKRTVYDYAYNRYADDYFYFRRYHAGCTLKSRFYGDIEYHGR